ncbi:hypothetical protein AA313_de0210183 [Arthrobotrys entomopaga]|nr:hypothetical protein AA313_de0210183 [Arthrobotrys entomopaga]
MTFVSVFRYKMPPYKNSGQSNNITTETSITVERRASSTSSCTSPMLKYSKAMRKLRIAASTCLEDLDINEPADKVTFNGQPICYQGTKTVYVWKVKHENLETEAERKVAGYIKGSASDNRKAIRWDDEESDLLTTLIERGDLFPELYDPNTWQDTSSYPTPPEPDSCSSPSHPNSPPGDDNRSPTRGTKRPRSPSVELGFDFDEFFPPEQPSDTAPERNCDEIQLYTAPLYPLPTMLSITTKKHTYKIPITKRCRLEPTEPSNHAEMHSTAATPRLDDQTPQPVEESPRGVSLNAGGLPDIPTSALETPVPQSADNAVAPVAASPTEPQSEITKDQVVSSPAHKIVYTKSPSSYPEAVNSDTQHGIGIARRQDAVNSSQAEEEATSLWEVSPMTADSGVGISKEESPSTFETRVPSSDVLAYLTSCLGGYDEEILSKKNCRFFKASNCGIRGWC